LGVSRLEMMEVVVVFIIGRIDMVVLKVVEVVA
jgi:hypothetical protein